MDYLCMLQLTFAILRPCPPATKSLTNPMTTTPHHHHHAPKKKKKIILTRVGFEPTHISVVVFVKALEQLST